MSESEYVVLLVDDDARLLRGLERHLVDFSCSVLAAVSAHEALALVRETPVDVVVCDNAMPGMSGVSFLAHLGQEHPDVRRIMLTGQVTDRDRSRLLQEIGVDAILDKPCGAHEVAATISTVLRSPPAQTTQRSRLEIESYATEASASTDGDSIVQRLASWMGQER